MPKPFGKIALSLSGGGVRAVGYHVGALSFLNHINYDDGGGNRSLLEDVATISTVSGGTLVGLGYAAELKNNHNFEHFYDGLRTDLLDDTIFIPKMLELMNTPHPPGPANRRYFVAAYAKLFRESFSCIALRKFDSLQQASPPIHLEDMIFNALEMYFGHAYRFQHGSFNGHSGSKNIRLEEDLAGRVLLSDIMASSSAIPGVFAPLEFPEDFGWPQDHPSEPHNHPRPDLTDLENSINDKFQSNGGETDTGSVTLTDGGMYDNQGMSAIIGWLSSTDLVASSRSFRRIIRFRDFPEGTSENTIRKAHAITISNLDAANTTGNERRSFWDRMLSRSGSERDPNSMPQPLALMTDAESDDVYNLFFVSDAPDYRGSEAIYEHNEKDWGFFSGLKLSTIGWVTLVGLVLGFLALVYITIRLITGPPYLASTSIWDLLALIIALLALSLAVVVTYLIRQKFKQLMNSFENANGSIWPGIRRLKLGEIGNMLHLRFGSLAAVLTNIMPNRVRNLNIETLLLDPLINSDTVVLSEMDDFMKPAATGLPSWLTPDPQMVTLATTMGQMTTRLWLSPAEFDDLVAVGQCTTCYNVLAQLMLRDALYPRTGSDTNPIFDNPLHQEVFDNCRAAWTTLQADPKALVPP